MIKYRRLDEDTYAVLVDGEQIFTVRRAWYRSGGWQWEVPEVMNGRVPLRSESRNLAVEQAGQRLRGLA